MDEFPKLSVLRGLLRGVAVVVSLALLLTPIADAGGRGTIGLRPGGSLTSQAAWPNAAIADVALRFVDGWGGEACMGAGRSGLRGSGPVPVYPGRDSTGKVVDGQEGDGQCRAFVNCVVMIASGGKTWIGGGNGNYFKRFLDVGAEEIKDVSAFVKGDVVQSGNGIHTWIIVSPVVGEPGRFNVVDSNHDYKETVMGYERNVALSSTIRAFRLGAVSRTGGAPTSKPTDVQRTTQTKTSITAVRGPVRAVYSWTRLAQVVGAPLDPLIRIWRGGRLTYQGTGLTFCKPADSHCGARPAKDGVSIVNLDADPEYEVIIRQYEGGGAGGCCFSSITLDLTSRGYWRTNGSHYGTPALADLDRDGRHELLGTIPFFSYGAGVCSTPPAAVFDYDGRHHRFVDMSRLHPAVVEKDSARFLAGIDSPSTLDFCRWSLAASWAADEVRLGRGAAAFRTLGQWAASGQLGASDLGETAQQFIARLRRDFAKLGIKPFR